MLAGMASLNRGLNNYKTNKKRNRVQIMLSFIREDE